MKYYAVFTNEKSYREVTFDVREGDDPIMVSEGLRIPGEKRAGVCPDGSGMIELLQETMRRKYEYKTL